MTKSSIMCNRVLNTPLTVTVTWYWSSVSNKTKISFSILAKKTQSTFCLDNMPVPTIQMIAWIKKMSLYLKNQTESTAVVEWKKAWILRREPISYQHTFLFSCISEIISSYSADILQQYSLAYSEPCRTCKVERFVKMGKKLYIMEKTLVMGKKLYYPWNSMGFRWFQAVGG